ncbi:hypothetical protein [Sodalis sp.]|uniref:hypothetical protein n=1 Tax=Sodalis sp. (in: enterobacteria) TaxID=1898979 RepID=UPI0038733553
MRLDAEIFLEVFDTVGRCATTIFVGCGQGDTLVSFESEANALRDQVGTGDYDVTAPATNILAEFPAVWVDKNIEKTGPPGRRRLVLSLYSPAAQHIISGFIIR